MNQTDVTIVLYGLDTASIQESCRTLSSSQGHIRKVWILLSGGTSDLAALQDALGSLDGSLDVEVFHRFDNLGFATGHNKLLAAAFADGASRALVLNPDVVFDSSGLAVLIAASQNQPQSLLGPTLYQINPAEESASTPRTDSLGIRWTSTGRHFDSGQGSPWSDPTGEPYLVEGVTGACLLVSVEAYETVVERTDHFFDDFFVAYREDAELGIRASKVGIPSFVVPVSGFGHVRSTRGFQRTNPLINLFGVRNRFLMRSTLGRHRPGSHLPMAARDLMVIAATLTIERSSRQGLADAWAVRRHERRVQKLLSPSRRPGLSRS